MFTVAEMITVAEANLMLYRNHIKLPLPIPFTLVHLQSFHRDDVDYSHALLAIQGARRQMISITMCGEECITCLLILGDEAYDILENGC